MATTKAFDEGFIAGDNGGDLKTEILLDYTPEEQRQFVSGYWAGMANYYKRLDAEA